MEWGGWLLVVGVLLVFIGFALIFIGVLSTALKGGKVEAGGVVLIGPIPVVVGTSWKAAVAAMVLALALMVLALLLLRQAAS